MTHFYFVRKATVFFSLLPVFLLIILPPVHAAETAFSMGARQLSAGLASNQPEIKKNLLLAAADSFVQVYYVEGNDNAAFNAAFALASADEPQKALRYLNVYLKRNPGDASALALLNQIRSSPAGQQVSTRGFFDYVFLRIMPFDVFWIILFSCAGILIPVSVYLFFRYPERLVIIQAATSIFIVFVGLFLLGRITYRIDFDGVLKRSGVVLRQAPAYSARVGETVRFVDAGKGGIFRVEDTRREWVLIALSDGRSGWIPAGEADIF